MAPVPWACASAHTTKQLESTSESGGRGVQRPVLQLCGCIHLPGSQGGREGVLQIPKQRLADRQTDVESSKLETKVGTTTSVWPGPPTPIFRPRRVKTQKLQICKRCPLSVPEMQSHSTQARKPKLPSDGNAGRVCKSPDVKRRHSAWWVAPTGATRLGGGAGPSIAGIAPGRRRT